MAYCPKRADIVWLSFSPQAGHEQSGIRPALVISPESYNARRGLALFCPISNQEKGYPFEVKLPEGLKVTGVILSDQLRSLDWKSRNVKFICRARETTFREVAGKLSSLLDF